MERGCVVLDQPQHAASSPRLRTSHALRLVFDTAALRSNGARSPAKGAFGISRVTTAANCLGCVHVNQPIRLRLFDHWASLCAIFLLLDLPAVGLLGRR